MIFNNLHNVIEICKLTSRSIAQHNVYLVPPFSPFQCASGKNKLILPKLFFEIIFCKNNLINKIII